MVTDTNTIINVVSCDEIMDALRVIILQEDYEYLDINEDGFEAGYRDGNNGEYGFIRIKILEII